MHVVSDVSGGGGDNGAFGRHFVDSRTDVASGPDGTRTHTTLAETS